MCVRPNGMNVISKTRHLFPCQLPHKCVRYVVCSERRLNRKSYEKKNMKKHSTSIPLPDKCWCVALCFRLWPSGFFSSVQFGVEFQFIDNKNRLQPAAIELFNVQRRNCSSPFDKPMTSSSRLVHDIDNSAALNSTFRGPHNGLFV